jgi:hypothetical protein
MVGAGVGVKRGRAVLTPITWHLVKGTGPVAWNDLAAARAWCRQHAGVERADWEYQAQHRRWRFRDQDVAVLFQLTWC